MIKNILAELKPKKELLVQLGIFLGIFMFYAFFRLYNIENRMVFDWDQENIATNVRNIIVDRNFTLIGPRAMSDTGFFLGPHFTYLMIPFFLLTNLHPSAMTLFIVFYTVFFYILSSWTLTKLFGFRKAAFFLLLWAFNPILINLDSVFWWPIVIPGGVIGTWFVLSKLYKKATFLWSAVLGLTLGFLVNMHFQAIFLLFFCGVFLITMLLEKKVNLKHLLIIFVSFAVQFIPLFLFDLRNSFLNSRLLLGFYGVNISGVYEYPTVWVHVFNNLVNNFLPTESKAVTMIFYLFLVVAAIYLYRQKKEFHKILYFSTALLFIFVAVMFSIYGKRPSEYYFLFIYPFIYMILIDFFLQTKRALLYIFIALLVVLNLEESFALTRTNMYGLRAKEQAVMQVKKIVGGRQVNVTFGGGPNADTGFRYLLRYHNVNTANNPTLPNVGMTIPATRADFKVGGIGITLPRGFTPAVHVD